MKADPIMRGRGRGRECGEGEREGKSERGRERVRVGEGEREGKSERGRERESRWLGQTSTEPSISVHDNSCISHTTETREEIFQFVFTGVQRKVPRERGRGRDVGERKD